MSRPFLYLSLLIAILAPTVPRAVEAARRAPAEVHDAP